MKRPFSLKSMLSQNTLVLIQYFQKRFGVYWYWFSLRDFYAHPFLRKHFCLHWRHWWEAWLAVFLSVINVRDDKFNNYPSLIFARDALSLYILLHSCRLASWILWLESILVSEDSVVTHTRRLSLQAYKSWTS